MCDKCPRPPVTRAFFVDAQGNERDIREMHDVIQDVFFPPATPEQTKALQEYLEAVDKTEPSAVYVIDLPEDDPKPTLP